MTEPASSSAAEDIFLYVGPTQQPGWLGTALPEVIIEPDLPIIDPHHHLWSHADDRYMLDDMLADVRGGHNVRKTVYVQAFTGYRDDGPVAMRPVGETEYAAAIARTCQARRLGVEVPAAIVGYADLSLGDAVAEVLAAHEARGDGRFRGIRMITARDEKLVSALYAPPAAKLMGASAFRDGFAQLDRFGMSFDAYLYHHQLFELAELANAFPNTPIILDHSGMALGIGPYRTRKAEVEALWRRGIAALAERPNVTIKIGGMALAFWGFAFHNRPVPPTSQELADAWRPYAEYCIEKFSPARAMFESNFPPDKAGCTYNAVWNAFKRIAAGYSADEKAALFHDTAKSIYRL